MNVAQCIIEAAAGRKVAVLGDLMLDEWIMGDASRISPEAPVPVVQFSRRWTAPGGAANVGINLRKLGAKVSVLGVVGDDEGGHDLAAELAQADIDVEGIICDASRPTTQKTRIMAQRQQIVRIDRESQSSFSAAVLEQLQEKLRQEIAQCDVLCISDYDKGLTVGSLVQWAIQEALQKGKKVTAGPKPSNMDVFQKAGLVSLNEKEAGIAAGFPLLCDADVERAGAQLQVQLQCDVLAITRGSKGVSLFEREHKSRAISAHEVEVFDVAGAGDTFLAGATLAILAGENAVIACELGNLTAAASVRHVGVVAVNPEELVLINKGS